MVKVLGIVQRVLSTHLISKAGFTRASAQTGAVTLIQRFGPALNINLHFHMLVLDGVYAENGYGGMRFYRVNALGVDELKALVHSISHRVARFLEKKGFLERDAESSYLALEPDNDDAMVQLLGHSITYRIAVGPQQGRKVFTLQALPPDDDSLGGTPHCGSGRVATEAGLSLHAGISTEAHQREKLERLCRYVSRPAVSEKRLALTWMQGLKQVFNIDIETCVRCKWQVKIIVEASKRRSVEASKGRTVALKIHRLSRGFWLI